MKKYVFVNSENINLSISLASNSINSHVGKGLQRCAPATPTALWGGSPHCNHTAEAAHQSVHGIKAFLLFLCIVDRVNRVVQGKLQFCKLRW